jgi:hypothetical protein
LRRRPCRRGLRGHCREGLDGLSRPVFLDKADYGVHSDRALERRQITDYCLLLEIPKPATFLMETN